MIDTEDLHIGSLINPNLDCFMLGGRFVVVELSDETVFCDYYAMGEKYTSPIGYGSYPVRLNKKMVMTEWVTRGETLKEWREKLKRNI